MSSLKSAVASVWAAAQAASAVMWSTPAEWTKVTAATAVGYEPTSPKTLTARVRVTPAAATIAKFLVLPRVGLRWMTEAAAEAEDDDDGDEEPRADPVDDDDDETA